MAALGMRVAGTAFPGRPCALQEPHSQRAHTSHLLCRNLPCRADHRLGPVPGGEQELGAYARQAATVDACSNLLCAAGASGRAVRRKAVGRRLERTGPLVLLRRGRMVPVAKRFCLDLPMAALPPAPFKHPAAAFGTNRTLPAGGPAAAPSTSHSASGCRAATPASHDDAGSCSAAAAAPTRQRAWCTMAGSSRRAATIIGRTSPAAAAGQHGARGHRARAAAGVRRGQPHRL
jgi:hypothetical protein